MRDWVWLLTSSNMEMTLSCAALHFFSSAAFSFSLFFIAADDFSISVLNVPNSSLLLLSVVCTCSNFSA